jgi:hypothetical protein
MKKSAGFVLAGCYAGATEPNLKTRLFWAIRFIRNPVGIQ